ncbi:SnoaL-like domain-containing protein [Mucilaginibacter lappiensis]|uniref:SnoaL-like domain-containing protein n=1 Tax=Mucilaginibacter lappiensis TaxID=354630 RepID=A0ABR6PFU8_9SPHI|nr:nuclear transport factor 2 family protein [Mucilaginibacter lappiensis]MBB6108640.1 hypothetical protein [Mucilaginibacter lappiensis]SIQ29760.1 SnoaL-like domain-containing protein [Mucilaginibacter lappiensis]
MKNEKVIRDYFNGWQRKKWESVESILTDKFTFTSPNDDDHININNYKEKCWPESDKIDKYNLEKIIEVGNEAFVRYQCWTTDGKSFRNTEYFRLSNGKIEEIEVFFGAGQGFPSSVLNTNY